MREHNLVSVAKGLGNAVEKGVVDGESFAKMQVDLAQQMFPTEASVGHALTKLMNTPIGREMVSKAARSHYERLQHASACGDAWDVQKRGPKAEASQQEHTTSDPEGVEEPYSKKHARLVAAGFPADEAHTMLHRTEKLKRGIG